MDNEENQDRDQDQEREEQLRQYALDRLHELAQYIAQLRAQRTSE